MNPMNSIRHVFQLMARSIYLQLNHTHNSN